MSTTLKKAVVKDGLELLGFRVNTDARLEQAVRDFQGAWNLGTRLDIDGLPGPLTSAALTKSVTRHKRGQSDLSAHFSFGEFRCRCGGYKDCRRIAGEGQKAGEGEDRHVLRLLVARLENVRAFYYPSGLTIVSGYRCPEHNDDVDGAKESQHVYGAAADIRPVVDKDIIRRNRWFSGIGYQASSDKVRHVDVRHVSGNNTTHSSTASPAVWAYS